MRHRYSVILLPCLLLTCCDKQGSNEPQKGAEVSSRRAAHSSDAPRSHESNNSKTRTTPDQTTTPEQAASREKELSTIAWDNIETNPQEASKAFMQLPVGSAEKTRLIKHFAMRLAEQDPDQAIRWAKKMGSEQEIAIAIGQIALVMAETDPRRAANLLSESGIEGHELDIAVVQVLQRWAAKSSPEAAAWVQTFPPGSARKAGLVYVVSAWTSNDASAAFTWLTNLNQQDVRNEAFLAMEQTLLQQPQSQRDQLLQYADAQTKNELEQNREQAMKEIGDNVIKE